MSSRKPTRAALGVKETAKVLALIGHLKDAGTTVILISHNMVVVVAVADHVVILKAGRKVAESAASGLRSRARPGVPVGAMPAAIAI